MCATEDELILPAKKKKSRSAVPVSEADLQPSGEEAPKAAILVAAASWSEFDFPKRKKKLRDVRKNFTLSLRSMSHVSVERNIRRIRYNCGTCN